MQNPSYEYEKPPPYFEDNKTPNWNGPTPPPPPQPNQPFAHHPHYQYPQPPSSAGYGAVNMEPVSVPITQVILVGGCPACRVGVLEDSFNLLGVLCAILFFPLGILCCLAMREKRCSNCGAIF